MYTPRTYLVPCVLCDGYRIESFDIPFDTSLSILVTCWKTFDMTCFFERAFAGKRTGETGNVEDNSYRRERKQKHVTKKQ